MQNEKVKIVFFGASKFVLPIIAMLQEEYDLQLIVTTETEPTDAVPAYCQQQNLRYISVKKITDDVIDTIKSVNAPTAVLAYFGLILPKRLLDVFPYGIINIHPSLLPEYRGMTPVQSALLDGKITTGVTIIKLDQKMDHGPILLQKEASIKSEDSLEILHDRLFRIGADMIREILPKYLKSGVILQEQQHEKATFSKSWLTRQDGFIDSTNPPSSTILNRKIRAYYPWPGVWTKLLINGKEKVVKLLPGHMLQVEGKKPVSKKDFINGYPELKEQIEKLLGNS